MSTLQEVAAQVPSRGKAGENRKGDGDFVVMPDTSNAPDPPISDFSSCPKFVPLAGVDGVRSLLRTFAAGGVLSFAAF